MKIMQVMKINKSGAVIIIIMVLLTGMIAVLAGLNYNDAKERAKRQHDATFVIQASEQSYTVDYALLQDIGIQDFTADRKSSGNPAVQINYQGVPLKKLCDTLEIELSSLSTCVAYAADGYTVAVSMDKVNDAENVFIAAGENGGLLTKREDGGDGPYMLIVVKDPFSQFWCKYLSEIEFK